MPLRCIVADRFLVSKAETATEWLYNNSSLGTYMRNTRKLSAPSRPANSKIVNTANT